MLEITFSTVDQASVIASLDGHLAADDIRHKILAKQVLQAALDGELVGILRYGFLWDEIPFINMIRVLERHQGKGIGKSLVLQWEQAMRQAGYRNVLTSTQSNESAQHFYRWLGYSDIGGFVLPSEPIEIVLHRWLD